MRILIAEDEITNQQIVRSIVSAHGQCECVDDGDKAVALFRKAIEEKNPFDLIILDIMMPSMDGQETLRNIRQIEKEAGISKHMQTKVIMLTALSDQRNVVEAFFKGGASAYIVKPIDKEKLISEMKKLQLVK